MDPEVPMMPRLELIKLDYVLNIEEILTPTKDKSNVNLRAVLRLEDKAMASTSERGRRDLSGLVLAEWMMATKVISI